MDSIGRVNQVIETLRRQIAESARQLDSTGTQRAARGQTASGSPDAGALQKKITDKLRKLDPADPEHSRRARRAFLESVLSWELGEDLLLDQRFMDMLDHIDTVMRANPDLNKRFDQLVNELQAGK